MKEKNTAKQNNGSLHHKPHLTPPQTIVLSFAAMILTGTFLLSLPMASQSGRSVGILNALFTATSANCVTGLVVTNTLQQWTVLGKAVILVLIQLGGLGLMTILMLGMIMMKKRLVLKDRMVIQASFNQSSTTDVTRLVKRIVGITLLMEGAGAVLLTLSFYFSGGVTLGKAITWGFFHSISAFCNAGFDIIGPSSLMQYRGNLAITSIVSFLIIAGGLGFVVWSDLWDTARHEKKNHFTRRFTRLKLHSKIALISTLTLIVLGMLLFLLFEWNNPETLAPLGWGEKVLASYFQSVTLRTAGFNTIDQAGLNDISKFLSCLLMLIGGSPAGTAGGFKTVTLALVFIAMRSVFRGKDKMVAFNRTLPMDLLQKALCLIFSMGVVVIVATFTLHFTEFNNQFDHSFLDLLFEVCSAIGTVGVTTGITPYLTAAGKMVITICMFVGRLGPVTIVVALNMRLSYKGNAIGYPEDKVVVG